ncbi:MAG: hypothetical protein IPK19_12670 [Chloroflexi bacterium]|nr:hypothetical protein [Chloroflexota bacterium]
MPLSRRLFSYIVLLSTLVLPGTQSRSAPFPPDQEPLRQTFASLNLDQVPAHYVVFQQRDEGAFEPVFYRLVEVDSSFFDAPAPAESVDRADTLVRVALADERGRTVFESAAAIPQWVRAEFHGEGENSPIDGQWLPAGLPALVVRVPVLPETTLVIQGEAIAGTQRFDLSALAADSSLPLHSQAISRQAGLQDSGPSANRVDLLLMGDGYTAAQQTLFESHVADFASQFFNISPYSDYRNFVKLTSLFTASPQSGADHPPYNPTCNNANPTQPTCCRDSGASSDPLAGTFVATAFDSTYCAFNIHRLLVTNYAKVLAAAASAPNWNEIIVLVNDPTYGGSGGAFSVVSAHSLSVQIAQHEYGHTFAGLADEYESAYPGYPACSDTDANVYNDCEPNVTNQTVRESIKWTRWIEPSTPVVTPPTSPYLDDIGLFQGARYLTSGMYRPGYNCLMRTLGTPLCAVAGEAYILRLYDGGWGQPAQPGISNIEPGTRTPPSAEVTIAQCDSQEFGAQLVGPAGEDVLRYRWLWDGVHVFGEYYTAPSGVRVGYVKSLPPLGMHTLTLEVTDTSPLIHDSSRAGIVTSTSWSITVDDSPCIDAEVQLLLEGRPAAPDSSYEITLLAALLPEGDTGPATPYVHIADSSGSFTLSSLSIGSYTLWVKGNHTLAATLDITIIEGTNAFVTPILREGDANFDDTINIQDFSLLAAAFGSATGQQNFNYDTDFNMDGAITIQDFSLLAANFGQTGEPMP